MVGKILDKINLNLWDLRRFYAKPINPLWILFGKCACGREAKECWTWKVKE